MIGTGRKKLIHAYDGIISVENLLIAWREFKNGKRNKEDVAQFERNLMDNLFQLRRELSDGRYSHAGYKAFKINDPKPRDIHKATVRDRLMHHAIYHQLYWFFDRKFIHDSYSCRKFKGTHAAIKQFTNYFHKVSKNDTRTCWVLKCDIRKFFASIDHGILFEILKSHIEDEEVFGLLQNIIQSFETSGKPGSGLPLGNLTSQLLVNVYMNEFDQFVKHNLKQKFYIRYADDFVFLVASKIEAEQLIAPIQKFLMERLKLEIHPNKLFIKTVASGVDFLGWIHFPDHRVLRTATRRRMMKKLKRMNPDVASRSISERAAMQSYAGMLSHGNAYKAANNVRISGN